MRSYEQLVFDDEGQLLNASLADYLLPTALEVPHMDIAHTVTPSPLNPLGIKGAGEAGAIPVGPLFAQAIEDALGLASKSVELNEIPLSPNRLFELTDQSCDDPRHRRRGQDRQGRHHGACRQGRARARLGAPRRAGAPRSRRSGRAETRRRQLRRCRRRWCTPRPARRAIYHICPNVSRDELRLRPQRRRRGEGAGRHAASSFIRCCIRRSRRCRITGRRCGPRKCCSPPASTFTDPAADGLYAEPSRAWRGIVEARRIPRALSGRNAAQPRRSRRCRRSRRAGADATKATPARPTNSSARRR